MKTIIYKYYLGKKFKNFKKIIILRKKLLYLRKKLYLRRKEEKTRERSGNQVWQYVSPGR